MSSGDPAISLMLTEDIQQSYHSVKHNNINHQIINILNSRQHVSAAVGHHQAKLEQSLGILNVNRLGCKTNQLILYRAICREEKCLDSESHTVCVKMLQQVVRTYRHHWALML